MQGKLSSIVGYAWNQLGTNEHQSGWKLLQFLCRACGEAQVIAALDEYINKKSGISIDNVLPNNY